MVAMHNLLGDGEAEACAPHGSRARLVDTVKTIKQVRKVLLGDADATVRNAHNDELRLGLRAKSNNALLGRIFHSIIEQIKKKADQMVRAGMDSKPWGEICLEPQALQIGQGLNLSGDSLQEITEMNQL